MFIPKVPVAGFRVDGETVASPGDLRSTNWCARPSTTLEKLAARLRHPCQRGFIAGRSMTEGVLRALPPLHRSLRFAPTQVVVVLVAVKAAFPSGARFLALGRSWGVEHPGLGRGRPPLRALYFGSTAQVMYAGMPELGLRLGLAL